MNTVSKAIFFYSSSFSSLPLQERDKLQEIDQYIHQVAIHSLKEIDTSHEKIRNFFEILKQLKSRSLTPHEKEILEVYEVILSPERGRANLAVDFKERRETIDHPLSSEEVKMMGSLLSFYSQFPIKENAKIVIFNKVLGDGLGDYFHLLSVLKVLCSMPENFELNVMIQFHENHNSVEILKLFPLPADSRICTHLLKRPDFIKEQEESEEPICEKYIYFTSKQIEQHPRAILPL